MKSAIHTTCTCDTGEFAPHQCPLHVEIDNFELFELTNSIRSSIDNIHE